MFEVINWPAIWPPAALRSAVLAYLLSGRLPRQPPGRTHDPAAWQPFRDQSCGPGRRGVGHRVRADDAHRLGWRSKGFAVLRSPPRVDHHADRATMPSLDR